MTRSKTRYVFQGFKAERSSGPTAIPCNPQHTYARSARLCMHVFSIGRGKWDISDSSLSLLSTQGLSRLKSNFLILLSSDIYHWGRVRSPPYTLNDQPNVYGLLKAYNVVSILQKMRNLTHRIALYIFIVEPLLVRCGRALSSWKRHSGCGYIPRTIAQHTHTQKWSLPLSLWRT